MSQSHWIEDAFIYAIYPLGFCGAPPVNDFSAAPQPRLQALLGWTDHLHALGVNTLALGPIFESTRHGYDTADYFYLDRRLGTREAFAGLCTELHARGFRILLDGVFNHVGRDFWAFRDLSSRPESSPYQSWFAGFQLGKRSPLGDPFWYEGWGGHYNLVKLNLHHPDVRNHLFQAVEYWMREYSIDGLRLDAADALDLGFIHDLCSFCHGLKADFWMWGEIVHGDYRRWANPDMLDAVTNYECYKGLYSSLNDRNYFEIAYALNRQFGPTGHYKGLPLYNFADNHDVNRVASDLKNPAHLYPIYALLFSMPGVPTLYYGSEWGIQGRRTPTSDRALRPQLELEQAIHTAPQPALPGVLARLAALRRASPALRQGDYRELLVRSEQLAFVRTCPEETVVVLLNAAPASVELEVVLPGSGTAHAIDLLNPGETFPVQSGKLRAAIPPCWARILQVQSA
jgi:cyclomaltodextrinase